MTVWFINVYTKEVRSLGKSLDTIVTGMFSFMGFFVYRSVYNLLP